jgi:hypothetical protein
MVNENGPLTLAVIALDVHYLLAAKFERACRTVGNVSDLEMWHPLQGECLVFW